MDLSTKTKTFVFVTFMLVNAVVSLLVLRQLHSSPTAPELGDFGNLMDAPEEDTSSTPLIAEQLSVPSDVQRLCREHTTQLTLLFPHVNKAGGRTLFATFAKNGRHVKAHRFITYLPRSAPSRYRFSCRTTHNNYKSLLSSLVQLSPDCVNDIRKCEEQQTGDKHCRRWVYTMRDPVATVLSAFYTSTGRGRDGYNHFPCTDERLQALMKNSSFTIEEYVRLPPEVRNTCQAHNRHVRYLSPSMSLDEAKQNLGRMAWVGFVEHMEESMRLLSYTLGLNLVRYTTVSNVNVYNKTLSPLALQVLREQNQLDIELYQYGLDLYRKRIKIMNADTTNEHFNPNQFECDTDVICWNKKGKGEAVGKDDLEEITHDLSVGNVKEYIVCAPRQGCYRDPVERWKGKKTTTL